MASEAAHVRAPTAAEILDRHARAAGAPVTVVFQVTDRCMYECVHCYETHGKRPELSLAEIDRIFGELAEMGVLFLTLTGGEFYMRRDADDLLRAARAHGFAVKLKTTGHHIDDRRADLIRDLGAIAVHLSVYSPRACVHDAVTQAPGSLERTLAAARRLRARGVGVSLNTPVMSNNVGDLADLARLARELGCEVNFDPKVTAREDGDPGPLRLRASDEALRAFYTDEATGMWGTVVASVGEDRTGGPLAETPCRAAQDTVGITPEGYVTACHTIPIPAGDLKERSFREIWTTAPELLRIRALTWAQIRGCNVCDVRAYCSRCHAMALLEDGDLAGPSREACRHAVLLRDLLRERGIVPAEETALPPPLAGREEPRGARRVAALRVIG